MISVMTAPSGRAAEKRKKPSRELLEGHVEQGFPNQARLVPAVRDEGLPYVG
jgi:hypothetical protein